MSTQTRSLSFARCTVALAAFAGGLTLAVAQDAAPAAAPRLNLALPAVSTSQDTTFSSSSADNGNAVADNHFDFVSAAVANAQPGQRRYGRPRYRGGNTNPDGSNKYAFLAGAGFTQPVGNTYHYLTPSYGIQVGAGRNFSRQIAVIGQFDYDHFGFNGRTISGQSYIYFNDPSNSLYGLDGTSHVWSFTVNPTYTILTGEGLGAYVVAGAGFYHKTANFTIPVQATGYDPYYYGYYSYTANQTIDKYTSNAPGVNGGFGLTYKISRFSNERLYGEVRYVYVFNSQRQGVTPANAATTAYAGNNFFPANSNRTSYIPVKFGIRF